MPRSRYQVVAKTGDAGLTNIQQSGSINDSGEVAFVGDVAGGEAIFVGGPNDATPRDITPGFLNPFRFFGLGIQINDNNQVAAVDRVSTGNLLTYARYWDAQGTDTHVDIARGSSPNLLTSDFDAISNFVGINNNNQVVFEGLDGSLENLYASSTLVSRLDPAQTALSAPQVSRPLIADDGSFVLQYKAGTTQQIEVFRQKTATGIASTGSSNWTQLGFSPGITDDGKVVAFYGSDTNGPGIFIYAYGAIERIAGVSGNGHKDPGERLVNGTDVGPFSSFSVNTRVSVKVQADGTLQVVFLGGISAMRVKHGVERGYSPRFGGELVLVKRAPFGEIGFLHQHNPLGKDAHALLYSSLGDCCKPEVGTQSPDRSGRRERLAFPHRTGDTVFWTTSRIPLPCSPLNATWPTRCGNWDGRLSNRFTISLNLTSRNHCRITCITKRGSTAA